MAAWGTLEQLSHKHKRENVCDFLRQGLFVLACVLICVAIDQLALEAVWKWVGVELIPLGVFQVLLLPFVLYVAAKLLGGSRAVLIERAPRPSESKRERND